MNTIPDTPRWLGLAEVTPVSGNTLLEGADGAYIAVIGIARSETDFFVRVKSAFAAMGFELIEMEEIERVYSLKQLSNADAVLYERFSTLNNKNPIEFGKFHTYKNSHC